jgi:hypothetical protein
MENMRLGVDWSAHRQTSYWLKCYSDVLSRQPGATRSTIYIQTRLLFICCHQPFPTISLEVPCQLTVDTFVFCSFALRPLLFEMEPSSPLPVASNPGRRASPSCTATTDFAFLVHSPETVANRMPPDVDNKPLARQKRRRTS